MTTRRSRRCSTRRTSRSKPACSARRGRARIARRICRRPRSRRTTCAVRRSRRSGATPKRPRRTRWRSRSIRTIRESAARAVADFYINGKGERGRDALRLGLELAQRGSRRALARRRRNAPLAADLAVLEAQALNDLGRSDEALERIDAALRIAPGRGDALHEKGVALFDLSRFAEGQGSSFRRRSGSSPRTRIPIRCWGSRSSSSPIRPRTWSSSARSSSRQPS